jgi:putative DNA primase/helicase
LAVADRKTIEMAYVNLLAPRRRTVMTVADVQVLRHQLRAAGYAPIPLFGKVPPVFGKNNAKGGLKGWEKLTEITPEQIDMWAKTWPDAANTGALTRLMPALDLDILNEDAVRTIEERVREQFEERGYVLVRIGLPPKRAILFRTNEPFGKIVVNVVAANGSAEKAEKVEFLGDG